MKESSRSLLRDILFGTFIGLSYFVFDIIVEIAGCKEGNISLYDVFFTCTPHERIMRIMGTISFFLVGFFISKLKSEYKKEVVLSKELSNSKENELRINSAMFNNLAEGIYLISVDDMTIKWANPVFEKMFGYDKGELIGKQVDIVNAPTDMAPEETRKTIVQILEETGQWHGEVQNIKKDGTHFWCYANVSLFDHPEFGKVSVAVHTDITDRKEAEESLIKERSTAEYERAKSDAIIASLGNGVSIQARDFKVIFQNDIHKGMIGEHLGEFCFKAYEGRDAVCDGCPVEETFKDGEIHTVIRSLEMDGEVRYFEITASPIKDSGGNISAGIEVVREITERKHMEDELKQALDEKDLLMKEVHHRVKNNLAVIQSLLSLQMKDISDDRSKAYFIDAQNRIKSMTMIHEMLQESDDITRLSSSVYIRKFVKTLFSNYKIRTNHIKLQYAIDDIELDVDTMIPLGLIINELVSNALKYAFPDDMKGELNISLKGTDDARYELVIKDTGVGLPEDFDIKKATSLGLLIVDSLVKQIRGTLEVTTKDGAEFRIIFSQKAVS